MYLAFLDEAGHTGPKNFTVCGLTTIKMDNAPSLCGEIEGLRAATGKLEATDFLKFVQSKPPKLTPAEHQSIKQEVVQKSIDAEVVFWGYSYFNKAAGKFDADRNRVFGFNVLISKFNKFLRDQDAYGTLTVDRIDLSKKTSLHYKNGFEYLREKFQQGNFNEPKKVWYEHDRVLSFSQSCEGTSHLCSINDILTGSLMYMVNGPDPAVRKILQDQLQAVMAKGPDGKFRDNGMSYYPRDKTRLDKTVVAEYDSLREFLNSDA